MTQPLDFDNDDAFRPRSQRETRVHRSPAAPTGRGQPSKAPPLPLGHVLGGVRLSGHLGHGSGGWVYAAEEVTTGFPYAVKVLTPDDDVERARAKTGFRRMARLRHRGVLLLDQIVEQDGHAALVMERLTGTTMADDLVTWANLPVEEACDRLIETIRQVAAALAWMHGHGLVHRDIKPTNLMRVTEDDRIVLIDYDLVGTTHPETDPVGFRDYLIFTPMYASPEGIFRQAYGPPHDLFSLGICALEALRLITVRQWRRERAGGTGQRGGQEDRRQVAKRQASDNRPALAEPSRSTPADRAPTVGIARDSDDEHHDRELIGRSLQCLHEAIPAELITMVAAMTAADPAERPAAMTVARLGDSRRPCLRGTTLGQSPRP